MRPEWYFAIADDFSYAFMYVPKAKLQRTIARLEALGCKVSEGRFPSGNEVQIFFCAAKEVLLEIGRRLSI